jgi:phosphate:Na+ symporter
MELCRGKVKEMAELSKKSIVLALGALNSYDAEKVKEVIRLESVIDKYEDVLGSYLVKISSENISTADSQSMSLILHSISDFERISDHAMEIVNSAGEIHKKELSFTKKAKKEIETLSRAINDICSLTVDSFCEDNIEMALHVEPLEEVIDTLAKNIKENHIKRLKKGKCTIEMGFVLEDILTGLERVSDHCSNIAVEMITIFDNDYSTHEYFKNFSNEERESFNKEFEKLLQRYPIGK